MKTGIRCAFAAVLLAVACVAGAGDNESNDAVGSMQGSWTGSISIRNCVSGDVLAGPFKGITTFHQGGTLSETREATDVVAHLQEQAVSAADRAVELLARRELAIDGFWRGAEVHRHR